MSELTIPHASPPYHIGTNIFMKYNQVPLLKKVIPLTDFSEEQFMLNPVNVFTINDNFSKIHVNQSTNEGAIQVTTY
jgi:hypothetical protein